MKSAIVTGASGNLGKSVVELLLKEGFIVSGTGQLSPGITGYEGVKIDLSDERAAGIWVQDIINKHNTIDTAILTVGGFSMGDISSTSTAAITEQVKLNFETAYNIARPVFIQMKKQGSGTIFLIGSQAGMEAPKNKGVVAYGLSKSLLFRLADLMNQEAEGTGIKVFIVVPFIIDTPQNRAAMPNADISAWQTPEQIAGDINKFIKAPSGKDSLIIY